MNVENEKVYSEISTANFIVKTDVIGCISSLNLKNEKSGYGILVEMGEDNWGKSQKYFFSITVSQKYSKLNTVHPPICQLFISRKSVDKSGFVDKSGES